MSHSPIERAEYFAGAYGRCASMDVHGKCPCMQRRRDQSACKHWYPSKATSWDELAAEQDQASLDRQIGEACRELKKSRYRAHELRTGEILMEKR